MLFRSEQKKEIVNGLASRNVARKKMSKKITKEVSKRNESSNRYKLFALSAHDVKIIEIKVSSKDLNEVSDDFCPDSWKAFNMNGKKVFLSPDGTYHIRDEAMKLMFAKDYPSEEIKRMKQGMIEEEGWVEPDFLPEGWLYKESFAKNKKVLQRRVFSPTFVKMFILWEIGRAHV